MKQGIQEFHRKYVLVPADKAANNVVVVCRLHYVNTLKQELDGTRAYLETDTDEVSVVNAHLNDLPVKSFLFVSMKAKTNFLRCIGYLSFTKDHTKLDLLQILALVLPLTLLSEGLSEPEFYGDLVYKFKKLKGINDFSFQFRKIITRYRRIGYNLNVMRQSACLVFNPIMVDNYAAFFNCTPVGRASDSMMAPT